MLGVAKGHVGIWVAGDIERPGGGSEDGFVSVGRLVEEQEVVALGDGGVADDGVAGGRAAEAHDRGLPTQQLLDGHWQERGVPRQRLALVRVAGEHLEAVGDQSAGRLVAGHQQREDEHVDVEVTHRLSVHPPVGEGRHEVVLRLGSPLLHHGVDVHEELRAQLQRRVSVITGGLDHGVGPAPEVGEI